MRRVVAATATSGTLAFDVTNAGTDVTEFYLLADDGLRIVGEAENIAPGASRTLTVVAQPGEYFTVCKPGMIGDGVGRSAFTVSGDAVAIDGPDAEQKQQAVDLYAAFVEGPGRAARARRSRSSSPPTSPARTMPLARPSRRCGPTTSASSPSPKRSATSIPRIDYREVDAVAEGLEWTGFHRIEKDLWVPAQDALNADGETPAWQDWAPSTPEERAAFGDQLLADVSELYDYVHSDDFEAALEAQGIVGLSNGAIALLDEVATGKITGEEDWWSGTDLWDFAANVEGSKMAFSLARDFAASKGEDGAAPGRGHRRGLRRARGIPRGARVARGRLRDLLGRSPTTTSASSPTSSTRSPSRCRSSPSPSWSDVNGRPPRARGSRRPDAAGVRSGRRAAGAA